MIQPGKQTTLCISEVLICFEAWAKLAQQWLVCAPLGIHLEAINKDLMPNKKLFGPIVHHIRLSCTRIYIIIK